MLSRNFLKWLISKRILGHKNRDINIRLTASRNIRKYLLNKKFIDYNTIYQTTYEIKMTRIKKSIHRKLGIDVNN